MALINQNEWRCSSLDEAAVLHITLCLVRLILVPEALCYLPDLVVPVGTEAEDGTEECAIYKGYCQPNPEPMEPHALAESQPNSEWNTFRKENEEV